MSIMRNLAKGKGLIMNSFNGFKQFFNKSLTIRIGPTISNNANNGSISISIDIDSGEEPVHSQFTMRNAINGGWYDIAIRPVEVISTFCSLSEIDHPDINYNAMAKYIFDLLYYLSEDYPYNGVNGLDPNSINYYIELGDQIESFIKDAQKDQDQNVLPFEQQLVNYFYSFNTLSLIQETICNRGILSVNDDGELITFCNGVDYSGKRRLLEIVCTNYDNEYLCVYTFINECIITNFIMPIINNNETFINKNISLPELQEYFATLYSIQTNESVITPAIVLANLKKQNDDNKAMWFIINNNKTFKDISGLIDITNNKLAAAKKKEAAVSTPYFRVGQFASPKIRSDGKIRYIALLYDNVKRPYDALGNDILNSRFDEASSSIINTVLSKRTRYRIIFKDGTIVPEKADYESEDQMFFETKEDTINWLHKMVDFSIGVVNKLIKDDKAACMSRKEWHDRVIDTLPNNNLVVLLIDEMLKSEAPGEFAKSLFRNIK